MRLVTSFDIAPHLVFRSRNYKKLAVQDDKSEIGWQGSNNAIILYSALLCDGDINCF